jgi:hypothetical protein
MHTQEATMMKQCKKSEMMAILLAALALLTAAVSYAAVTKTAGSFYEIRVETARAAGSTMHAIITTVGKNGYHCNMLYPWKLTVGQGDGISVSKPVMKKPDAEKFTESAVVFRVPYTATDAVKTMSASLKLSLCDDKQCQMETVALSWPAR